MPTFSTRFDRGAFVEISDPTQPGQPKRPGAGFPLQVRAYPASVALDPVTTSELGYIEGYVTDTATIIEVSADGNDWYRVHSREALDRLIPTGDTLPPANDGWTKQQADDRYLPASYVPPTTYATKTYVDNSLANFDPTFSSVPCANSKLKIIGAVIRLYDTGPEIHANSGHVNVGITSVEIVGSVLRIQHDQSLPVVSITTQPDETLSGLRGIICGPSGGSGLTNVYFFDTILGRALDLSVTADYARVSGESSNLWFQVVGFDESAV